jgi:hypothetical protein
MWVGLTHIQIQVYIRNTCACTWLGTPLQESCIPSVCASTCSKSFFVCNDSKRWPKPYVCAPVYTWGALQEFHQMYGCKRCIHMVLANPTHSIQLRAVGVSGLWQPPNTAHTHKQCTYKACVRTHKWWCIWHAYARAGERIVKIALWCCMHNPAHRPSCATVFNCLKALLEKMCDR